MKRKAIGPGGPDGLAGGEFDQATKAEFQRVLTALPAGLFFLPLQHTTPPAATQLALPLKAPRARSQSSPSSSSFRTQPRIPHQSQPTLSAGQQEQVLARVRAGESYRDIAPDFGVSYGAIYRLVKAARRRGGAR